MKNLIIVESPAKAKTIQKFIGKEYDVISSKGHVRDLPQKDLGVDITKGFIPKYEILPDKKKLIAEINKMTNEADCVLLATDDDREGEAISWHLIEAAGIPLEKTKRIVFHEITKSAIEKAITNPRELDIDLVNAQQARRVLDRLVGFELSPVLWRKVRPNLSAGRVQSVAVKLIVEREREINKFQSTFYYKTVADFVSTINKKVSLDADLNRKIETKEEAEQFLEDCKKATFHVSSVEKSPGKKSPAAPFTTSTLQQEAARKLGFSVSKTMIVAQQLYEAGYITYMRTDSVNLSEIAIKSIEKEVVKQYGKEYAKPRRYVTKTRGAQEAHEAIRPTDIIKHTISGDTFAKRLYELIWKRTIASQMSDAETEKTSIIIPVSNREEKFIATGEVILFYGFLKVYTESKDEEDEEIHGLLPVVSVGEILEATEIRSTQKFAQPPVRFSEASLVKKLEELGIGRPSTYAPTISTIQKRNYVVKETRPGFEKNYIQLSLKNKTISETTKVEKVGNEKDKLFPTDIGSVVNEYLQNHFANIMDYGFTAQVEKEFDDIAEGSTQWQQMLHLFYTDFHHSIDEALTHTTKVSGERLLGQDPKTGDNLYAKLGKYGAMVQIGENYDDQKPRYARLKSTQSIDTITLKEALDLFKLPCLLGNYEGKDVSIGIGKFGPFVRHGSEYASLPKGEELAEITLEKAINAINAKRKVDQERAPKLLGTYNEYEVSLLNGKYGPYLKYNDQNITLDKNIDIHTITLDDALILISNAKTKNVLHSYSENEQIKIMNGRYGAYITDGNNNYKIPKGVLPENITYKECMEIIENTNPTTKKRFVRKKG